MNYNEFWDIVRGAQVSTALTLIAVFLAILVWKKQH